MPSVTSALLVTLALTITGHAQVTAQGEPSERATIDVVHFDATLEPDLRARTVAGTVRIRVVATNSADALTFDRGALEIDCVRIGTVDQRFDLTERRVFVHLSPPLPSGATREIEITYHGTTVNQVAAVGVALPKVHGRSVDRPAKSRRGLLACDIAQSPSASVLA